MLKLTCENAVYPEIMVKNIVVKTSIVNLWVSWKPCIFQIFQEILFVVHGLTAFSKILTL